MLREVSRGNAVAREHQVERDVGMFEAPGGVHPRPDREPERLGVETRGSRTADFGERFEARAEGLLHLREAGSDDSAVLIDERRDIDDGAQGDEVEERMLIERFAGIFVEHLQEAVGDPAGGQLVERIGRIEAFRVDRGERGRQHLRHRCGGRG